MGFYLLRKIWVKYKQEHKRWVWSAASASKVAQNLLDIAKNSGVTKVATGAFKTAYLRSNDAANKVYWYSKKCLVIVFFSVTWRKILNTENYFLQLDQFVLRP